MRSNLGGIVVAVGVCVLGGCGVSGPKSALVSVREAGSGRPVSSPHLTIRPADPDADKAATRAEVNANQFGHTQLELEQGEFNYVVTIDAEGYDVQRVTLPVFDETFPNATWHEAKPIRKHPFKPDTRLEVLVTVETEVE